MKILRYETATVNLATAENTTIIEFDHARRAPIYVSIQIEWANLNGSGTFSVKQRINDDFEYTQKDSTEQTVTLSGSGSKIISLFPVADFNTIGELAKGTNTAGTVKVAFASKE